jgi:hypothetical protein
VVGVVFVIIPPLAYRATRHVKHPRPRRPALDLNFLEAISQFYGHFLVIEVSHDLPPFTTALYNETYGPKNMRSVQQAGKSSL